MGAGDGQQDNRWSDSPLLPRWVLWIMAPGIIAPMLIFGFIVFTESAHDEARCPYAEVTRREIEPGVAILEERRNCIGDVEERRYTLLRGAHTRLLGRRRFDRADFAAERYHWSAEISTQGEVVLNIHNEGHDDLLLREGTAEEHDKGISH